jgi:hypothetical protein
MLAWARARPSLWAVYAALAAVTVWIGPLRSAYYNDDFAYARMVQHYLRVRRYQPDAWTAAHLPFQVLWGALFSLPFGCSPGALRVSTLSLFALALGCFYQLLRDHDTPEREAGLLTFVLLSSPLVLYLAFGFMTDVHYLSWLVAALFGYARGLARGRLVPVVLGSMAGFMAIGTRQVGAALVCGLLLLWALDASRRRRAPLYVAGLLLPAGALFLQYRLGRSGLAFTQRIRLVEEAAYLDDRTELARDLWWRPAVVLQYVGWSLLPLLPVVLTHYKEAVARRARGVRPLLLCVAAALFGYGCFVAGAHRPAMPALPWLLGDTVIDPREREHIHDAGAVFGVLILWLVLRRYVPAPGYRGPSLTDKLMGLVAAATLGANLIYVQFGDRYTIVFIPFVLWIVGRTARPWSGWTRAAVLAGSAYLLSWGARWTLGNLEMHTALFSLGDLAVARGADPHDVAVCWPWQNLHGAFDDWVESVHGRPYASYGEFWVWLGQRGSRARYVVIASDPGERMGVVGVRTWRDRELQVHHYWLVDRRPQEPHR